jgi:hypothetical protein
LGTNGAVEAYLEALAAQAAARFGGDDLLAGLLREERDGFFSGKVVRLDECVADVAGRERFLAALDAATDQLYAEFTKYGRERMQTVVAALRARVAGST